MKITNYNDYQKRLTFWTTMKIMSYNDYQKRLTFWTNMNEKLFDPLCSLIAANVFGIFGSPQQKVMLQEVDNFIKSEL